MGTTARIAAEEKTAIEKSRLDQEATEAQNLRDETEKVKLEKVTEVARLSNEKAEKEQEIKQAEQLKAIAEAEKAMLDEAIATDKACIENNAAVLKDLEQEKELTEQNVDELTKATEKLNEQKEDLSTTVNELADSVQKLQEEKELLEVSKQISQTETKEVDQQAESVLSLSNENVEDAPENKTTEPITEEQVEKIPEMEAEANELQPTVSVERRLSTEIVKQSFTDLTKPETDQTEQEVEQEARGEALMMIEAATSSFRREELLKEKAEREAAEQNVEQQVVEAEVEQVEVT